MNLTGDLKERVRQLLGGKNVTKKRLEKLLDEIKEQRDPVKPLLTSMAETTQRVVLDHTRKEMFGEGVSSRDAGMGQSGDAPPPTEPAVDESKEVQILRAELAQMRAKIEDLSKPATAKATEEAVAAGRLPVTTVQPGPVGYTGSAQLPRGKWFIAPFGPKIQMKLCDCAQCVPHRFFHYYCVICRTGPHPYLQHQLGGRKVWMAPGSTWGIPHECCSPVCWQQYQGLIGGRGAPLDAPVLGAEEGEGQLPPRQTLGVGSD